MISYGKHSIDKEDIKAVNKVLKSNMLTQGPLITKFEEKLSSYFGSKFATVVSNGTAALHLCAVALEWKPNDVIITSSITFLSSATAAYFVGSSVSLVDIDKVSYTICIKSLEDTIIKLRRAKKRVVAVIGVDYAGHPSDWKGLKALSKKYRFKLINDNCHSMGARYYNNIQYASKYADLVTHSYHPVKNITTGEGGAILTNNQSLDKKIKYLRSHNMKRDSLTKKKGPWEYYIDDFGFNYRLTDFQCALGISQLKKLNKFIIRRQKIAKIYDDAFSNDDRFIIPLVKNKIVRHAYHLYPLQIKFENLQITKKKFFEKMKSYGILLQVHYIPLHFHPFFKKNLINCYQNFPNAEKFYSREVSIPIFPTLKNIDQKKIISLIKSTLK
tara:strand:+ start:937 stop:2094 length:1158 start_codon:yes stop_codon:yes gene_type:complete